jgi:hypothetical protein
MIIPATAQMMIAPTTRIRKLRWIPGRLPAKELTPTWIPFSSLTDE